MSIVQIMGRKVFYATAGKGKPVILLHGFGEDHRFWDGMVPLLQEECRLILPDIPGSGQSELLEGSPGMKEYAEVVQAIAAHEGLGHEQPFCLMGHSMGGYIALAFAELYPDLLSGLGLVHSSAYADDEEKKGVRQRAIEFIGKNGAQPFLKSSIPNLFASQTVEQRPWLIDKAVEFSRDISPEALIQYYQAMMKRPDRTQVLQSFKKPVLFLIGKFDKAVSLEISLKQCHIPRISYIRILESSGHMGIWEEETEAGPFLLEFLGTL
ncbi:MAG: alpha/beta hydrolase [Bacteroidota bacterium]|nr:alpha/beta hydrolase [Bacteroidota bacterium]